jgi:multiphosphoryl transfer protein
MTVASALVIALPDALHARPASLLVRLAASFDARVTVTTKGCKANAASILEVLALGAARGDSISLTAEGVDAERALTALYQLVDQNFDGDLVPERGEGGAAGMAIGRAFVIVTEDSGDAGGDKSGDKGGDKGGDAGVATSYSETRELARLERAAARVESDLGVLLASLPEAETPLFAPALPMLADLARLARQAIGDGSLADVAVRRHTEHVTMDLVLDVRARLLDALAGGDAFARALAPGVEKASQGASGEERILVTENLVPSHVALAPASIVGIVASRPEGQTGRAALSTSHAAILARGRGLPLAIVPQHVTQAVVDDEWIVVDATEQGARVWVAPSETLLLEARRKRAAQRDEDNAKSEAALDKLEHLGVAIRVNIGALAEVVPKGAEGIGLVRTELLFAGRRQAPDDRDLVHAFSSIAKAAGRSPVVIRLYDAGGDKPLEWLPPPEDDPDSRGIALLLHHPEMCKAQLRAVGRLVPEHDARVLIPLTRDAEDVHAVRRLLPDPAPRLLVGAMIETPDAVEKADAIAAASDFVCIGTNDLTASLGSGEPLVGRRVLALVERIVKAAKEHARTVTVCGEMAADPRGARALVGLGVHALSVSPNKLVSIKDALRRVTLETCRNEALRLLAE